MKIVQVVMKMLTVFYLPLLAFALMAFIKQMMMYVFSAMKLYNIV